MVKTVLCELYFKTLGGYFWHLTFLKFWFPKKENYCNVSIPTFTSFTLFPENPENSSVFKNKYNHVPLVPTMVDLQVILNEVLGKYKILRKVCRISFFYSLGFLSRTFTNHTTVGEGGEQFFNYSLPLPLIWQTHRH